MANEVSYIEYKGRAFVRENDTICYGNMTDPYVATPRFPTRFLFRCFPPTKIRTLQTES